MSKAEMILYSPASYFLYIIVVQIIKEPIFLWDICDFVMFIFAERILCFIVIFSFFLSGKMIFYT